jgi:murein DD-endopeptidase MepM/ murein hydrolase activator NlpD
VTSPESSSKQQRGDAPESDGARISRKTGAVITLAFAVSIAIPMALAHFQIAAAEEGKTGVGMPELENADGELPGGMGSASEGIPEPAAFSAPEPLYYTAYRIEEGDTIGEIASRFGLAQDTILTFNSIKNSRLLQIGKYLKIPNQDGILYTTKEADSVETIAERYEIEASAIRFVNGAKVESDEAGTNLFLPEARLSRVDLQEINGDLFIWPVRGYVSSTYGYRISPFTGARQFHSGLDIAAPHGSPVKAAMAGRVSVTGYDVNTGNYIVISHHSGYRTLYGHLDVIRVVAGEYVKTGQRIGDVGSTGLSTGSHTHFTVFKNGVTVNPRALIN